MNKSISDIIEEFIVSSLDDDEFIELQRNDLAKFFSCVPSQINYVLNTRFTLNRGFLVESQRGGSGYIKVHRVMDSNDNYLNNLLLTLNEPLTIIEGNQIIDNLIERKLITENEGNLIKSTLSKNALNSPFNIENKLRANILKSIVLELIKRK